MQTVSVFVTWPWENCYRLSIARCAAWVLNINYISHHRVHAFMKLTSDRCLAYCEQRHSCLGKTCIPCQRCKESSTCAILCLSNTRRRFSQVHLDNADPLLPANSHRFFQTCVDRFTGWIMAVLVTGTFSETVSKDILRQWIFTLSLSSTDGGAQFQCKSLPMFTTLLWFWAFARPQTILYLMDK